MVHPTRGALQILKISARCPLPQIVYLSLTICLCISSRRHEMCLSPNPLVSAYISVSVSQHLCGHKSQCLFISVYFLAVCLTACISTKSQDALIPFLSGNGHFPSGQFSPDNSTGQFPLPTRTISPVPLKTKLENYIYTIIHTCMHTCIHIYIHAYTHRCMHTRIYNTYMHTCIYIYSCIHNYYTLIYIDIF